jgi:DNA-binding Xre family transcriptional regulator
MEYYPTKFSPEARAAVEAELIRAGRLHDKRKADWDSDWPFPLHRSLQENILTVFLVYAREPIELGRKGVWTVDQVRSQALERLRHITLEIKFKRNYDSFTEWNSGSIRPETQREFEATAEWRQFEDELLALAESLQKPPGNDVSSQTDLPELPQSTKRKLDLKWSDLLEKYHLAGEHLHWHEKARLRRDTSRLIDNIGIVPSVNVAEHRFTDLASTYWSMWSTSTPHEVFLGWLDAIKGRTAAEIESGWVVRSDSINSWYKRACAAAIEKELDTHVREWTKKARTAELAYLERYGKTPATLNPPAEKGNPGATGKNASDLAQTESSVPGKPKLNLARIGKFIEDEGYKNDDLAGQLGISLRAVSSLRNDGEYHGADALTKLANLMKCEVEDLFVP